MSEQTYRIDEEASRPSMSKKPERDSVVRCRATCSSLLDPAVDLIDQGDVVVAFAPLDLVHPDRFDAAQAAVAQAVIDHRPHGREDGVPTGPERLRGLLPAQPPRPPGQEQLVGLWVCGLFPSAQGTRSTFTPATRAPHPAHPVAEIEPASRGSERNWNSLGSFARS